MLRGLYAGLILAVFASLGSSDTNNGISNFSDEVYTLLESDIDPEISPFVSAGLNEQDHSPREDLKIFDWNGDADEYDLDNPPKKVELMDEETTWNKLQQAFPDLVEGYNSFQTDFDTNEITYGNVLNEVEMTGSDINSYLLNNFQDNFMANADYCISTTLYTSSALCNFRSAWLACTSSSSPCQIQLPSNIRAALNASVGTFALKENQQLTIIGGTNSTIYSSVAAKILTNQIPGFPFVTGPLTATSTATVNYAEICVTSCPGSILTFSGCNAGTTGDTYFRLYVGSTQVASNDDSCGSKSQITYTVTQSTCSNFCLRVGCYGSSSCSVSVMGTAKTITPNRLLSYTQTTSTTTSSSLTIKNMQLFGFGDKSISGGALSINGNLTLLIANVKFRGNLGSNGGAIAITNNAYSQIIRNCTFVGNSATNGGAIYLSTKVTGTQLTASNFISNTASTNGGAIYVDRALLIQLQQLLLQSNSAGTSGGALYFGSYVTSLTVNKITVQRSIANSGGCMYISSNNKYVTVSKSTFQYCVAKSSGGGIFINSNNRYFTLDSNFFQYGAAAYYGGAVSESSMQNIFMRHIHNQYDRCYSLQNGGGLQFGSNDVLYNLTFTNCRTQGSGGGIYVSGTGMYMDLIRSHNCSSLDIGGFMYGFQISNATMNRLYINQSSANDGGDIYIYGGSIGNTAVVSSSIFTNAYVRNNGGSFYIYTMPRFKIWNCQIIGSMARKFGGAIFVDNNSPNFVVNRTIFIDNQATLGGGIYLNNNVYYTRIISSTFTNNSGATSGGALYFNRYNQNTTVFQNVFTGNVAKSGSGGAVAINQYNSDMYFLQNTFRHNQALLTSGGAASIIFTNTRILWIQCLFELNQAKVSGGGLYLQNNNVQVAILDQNSFKSLLVVQSTHPYSSGYPDYQSMKPFIIYNATISVPNINEYIINFDGLSNMYYTETFTIYDSMQKNQILFQTSSNQYPGVNLPPLNIARKSFFVQFIGPTYFGKPVASGYYGFKMYVFPVVPVNLPTQFLSNTAASGGGLSLYYTNVFSILLNSEFIANQAKLGDGGGIVMNFGNGGTTMQQLTLRNNIALSNGGGLEFVSGHYANTIKSTLFFLNQAQNGAGGGLSIATGNGDGMFPYGNRMNIEACSFANNTALTYGGGVFVDNKNLLNITSSSFTFNQVQQNDGGGLMINTGNSVNLKDNNQFTKNVGRNCGGGISIDGQNVVNVLNNLTLTQNYAMVYGGGICMRECTVGFDGKIVLSQNRADFVGGGIAILSMPVWSYLSNSASMQFTKNVSPRGSAVFFYGIANSTSTSTSKLSFATASGTSSNSLSNILFDQNIAAVGGTTYWVYNSPGMSQPPQGLNSSSIQWSNNLAIYGSKWATQGISVHCPMNYMVNQFATPVDPPIEVTTYDYYQQLVVINQSSTVAVKVVNENTAQCVGQNPYISGDDLIGSGVSFTNGIATFSKLEAYCAPTGNMTIQFEVQIASLESSIVPSYLVTSYYIHNTTQLQFRHCKAGEYISNAECITCPQGTYNLVDDSFSCEDCTSIAGIDSCYANQLIVKSGYWRRYDYTTTILSCSLTPDSCIGGNVTGAALCAEGYGGPLCAVCANGYAMIEGQCKICSPSQQISPTIIVLLLVAGTLGGLLTGYIYIRYIYIDASRGTNTTTINWLQQAFLWIKSKYAELGVKLKIVVSTYQIVTSSTSVLSVQMPGVFMRFTNAFSFLDLNLTSIIPMDCTGQFNFMTTLLVTTLSPMLLIGFLLIAFALEYFYTKQQLIQQNRMNAVVSTTYVSLSSELMSTYSMLKDKYINYIFLVTYLVLPSVTTTIFQTFVCQNIDPDNQDDGQYDWYLVADMNISCETTYYYSWVVYAVFMILLYPVGIPTMYFYFLYQNREEIMNRNQKPASSPPTPSLETSSAMTTTKGDAKQTGSEDSEECEDNKNYDSNEEHSDIAENNKGEVVNPMLCSSPASTDASNQKVDIETGAAAATAVVAVMASTAAAPKPLSSQAARLSFLFAAYKPHLWYWEMIETTRRLMLTSILSVCQPGSALQNILSLLLALAYIKLYSNYHPYAKLKNDLLAEIGQFQIFFTFFVGLIIQNNLLSGGWNTFLGVILTMLNLSVVLILIYFEVEVYRLQMQRNQIQTTTNSIPASSLKEENENNKFKADEGIELQSMNAKDSKKL